MGDTALTNLDLSASAATSFGRDAFNGCRALPRVDFGALPVTTIGNYAFHSCTSLRHVTPLLPETVTTVGGRAFLSTPVEGSLRIGFGGTLSTPNDEWGGGHQFEGTKITEIITGPGATSLGPQFAQNCRDLARADFTESLNLATLSADAFRSCPSLLEVRFASYPAFGGNVFNGVSANARFFLALEAEG